MDISAKISKIGILRFNKQYSNRIIFPNGNVYTDNIVDNSVGDSGTMHYPNGDIYQGNFKNELRHGYGILSKFLS